MNFRKLNTTELEKCHILIKDCYDSYVAKDYEDKGNAVFYDFISVESLRKRLLENSHIVVAEEKGQLLAMIEFKGNHLALFFTHVDFLKQGIGKMLFNKAIDILKLEGKIDVNSSPYAVEVYRHLGFVPYDDFKTQDGITFMPMQQIVSDVKLRSETMYDFEAIDKINNKAFGQEGESKLIRALRKSPNFNSELSIIAIEDQQAIGHILMTEIMTDTYSKNDLLALAPMAVCSEHQNKKIGSLLILEGIRRAYKLGYKGIVVLGHKDYYPKFGFKKASEYNIKCPFPVPDEIYMALPLYEDALKDIEGTVIYPDAFRMV